MPQGRGSLEVPIGASKPPRPKETQFFCAGTGRSLLEKEFAGTAAADPATSASALWNPRRRERGEELKGAPAEPGGRQIGSGSPRLLLQPARKNTQKEERLCWHPDQFTLVFHVYSSQQRHFPYIKGRAAAPNGSRRSCFRDILIVLLQYHYLLTQGSSISLNINYGEG